MKPRDYRRYKRPRLAKESRTIPYPGVGKTGGQLYRCWYCGFICDEKRDYRDDGNSKWNISYIQVPLVATEAKVGFFGGMLEYLVYHEVISDGSPRVVAHTLAPNSGQGCPNCYTPNWRGDY